MLATTLTPSFEEIRIAYSKAIQNRIAHYIQDKNIAKDVQQEVLIKIWKKLSSYDIEKGSCYSWIATITSHTCIDYLRTVRKTQQPDLLFNVHDENAQVHGSDFFLRRQLLNIANKLNVSQRQILIMVYFRGYTQLEVSQLLKLPLGTVKTRHRSALRTLRRICGNGSN